jgi:hypothetical protein
MLVIRATLIVVALLGTGCARTRPAIDPTAPITRLYIENGVPDSFELCVRPQPIMTWTVPWSCTSVGQLRRWSGPKVARQEGP